MDRWAWVYEIINEKREPKPELPEDVYWMMLKRYPILEEFMERLQLEIEI